MFFQQLQAKAHCQRSNGGPLGQSNGGTQWRAWKPLLSSTSFLLRKLARPRSQGAIPHQQRIQLHSQCTHSKRPCTTASDSCRIERSLRSSSSTFTKFSPAFVSFPLVLMPGLASRSVLSFWRNSEPVVALV